MSESDKRPLRVALLGCGVVGTAVARLLTEQRGRPDRAGRPTAGDRRHRGAAGRPATAPRPASTPALFTTDAEDLVTRADVVVEVIGGIEPARSPHPARDGARRRRRHRQQGAARRGRPDPVRTRPPTHGVDLYYEAAVAGAIPLLRPLRESLAGDDVRRVLGIVNGTTNYVLDKMDSTGAGFADAVEQAQALGYAEADPTADVEGFDAAAKAAILASLAFHTRVARHRRLPRGHHRGHGRRRRRGTRDGLRRQAARHLRAHRPRWAGRRRERPGAPGDDPAAPTRWPVSARRSTPSSSRPTPPGS